VRRLEGLGKLEKCNEIGTRTCDLPARSIVPIYIVNWDELSVIPSSSFLKIYLELLKKPTEALKTASVEADTEVCK
jgi:hypothetical protein